MPLPRPVGRACRVAEQHSTLASLELEDKMILSEELCVVETATGIVYQKLMPPDC